MQRVVSLGLERTCDWCGASELVQDLTVPPWDRVVVHLTLPRIPDHYPIILAWDVCPACAQTVQLHAGPYPTWDEWITLQQRCSNPGPESRRVGSIFRDALGELAQVLRTPEEPLSPPVEPGGAPKGGIR